MIDWYAEQSDKFIGTTAAILSAVAAGAAGTASVVGAKMQSGAAKDAATAQTNAANHAADLQDAAAQRAEAFQRQQAENQWQNAQATQLANYNQSKARYGSISGVASQYGLNLGAMPDYAPGIDPHYDTGSSPLPGTVAGAGQAPGTAPTANGAPPAIDASKGDLAGQISAYFKSRGVSDQETPYWVQKWSEFGAKDPAYFNQRLAAADVFGGGAGTVSGAAKAPASTMVAPSMTAPAVNTQLLAPYAAGTIASYGRRA